MKQLSQETWSFIGYTRRGPADHHRMYALALTGWAGVTEEQSFCGRCRPMAEKKKMLLACERTNGKGQQTTPGVRSNHAAGDTGNRRKLIEKQT